MIVRYILLSFLLLPVAHAQVSINALNTPHSQDFNSLVTSGSVTWTDNSTLSGWYHTRTGNGNLLLATNGNTTAGGFYSFGTGTDTERALGSIGSGNAAVGSIWYGIRLVNNTGTTVTTVDVTYIGEQWRNSAAAAQTVTFSYMTGTNLASVADGAGTWTTVSALNFTSPVTGGSSGALDGNASANRMTISASITGLSIPSGGEIMLRWYDPDHSGSDHGLGIDDLSVAFQGSAGPTSVQFASASSSFTENAGAVTIAVSIANPSPSNATTVQVALTGGTASNGSDVQPAFATQTLTFPAGSSANQTATLTIFDDALFEGSETLLFELQSVSGGNAAFIGAQSAHTLTILDNDPPPVPTVIVNEYFNANGNIASDEGVELIVVQDGLDMRGFSLADATSGGTYPFGVLTFSSDPLWSSLQAGTIIVIGGIFSVPANDTDASDGLLKIQTPTGGTSNQYFSHSSNTFSLAGSSDAVAIRDAGANFIHGLAHGSSNSGTLPSGRHGWKSGSVGNGESVHFTRSGAAMTDLDFVVNTYVGTGSNSLGNPNDADGNRDYLRAKRSRTISANRSLTGTFFWDITVNSGTVNLTGAVNVCNALVINSGTLNENALGLSIDGNGNSQNGTGAGNITVGDNGAPAALLNMFTNFGTITGAVDFNKTDGTIDYRGTNPQTVLPAIYGSLNLTFGGIAAQKTLQTNATVNGTLSILSGAWLNVAPPAFITLGPTGSFVNSGRFVGSIQSTRTTSTGVPEAFGGIGMTITPTAGGASTTVRMTSGYYLWIGNLPSILKYYTVTPVSYPASIVYSYLAVDLNGQTESDLGLKQSIDAGATWMNQSGALNTGTKTITYSASNVGGIWTAHANPPQGIIASDKAALTFEAEQNFTLPPAQTLNISNQNGNGSIIEWSASAATATVPSWMELVPASPSGVNSGSFIVNVTRTDLNPGTYNGQITLTDIHAANSPKIIPVTYLVHAPRRICLGVDTIFIKANYKKSNPKKSYAVMNCGGTFGADVINWNATTTTPWLSLNPASGVEGDALNLTASTFQQNPGNSFGSITITGTHSLRGTPIANSPLIIPVVLEVEPTGDVSAATGPLTPGNTHTIKNQLGQRVLDVRLVSGSISNINVRMMPMQLPEGMALLRYAYRHYLFDVSGSNYVVDVTLYYTSNELEPFMVTAPWELRGWRQFPVKGVWHPTTSFSEPEMNRVTIQGITDLAGAWASATPMFPQTFRNGTLSAEWFDETSSVVRWHSSMRLSEIGFLVERASSGRNDWATVGIVPLREDGEYLFKESVDASRTYDYRLVSIDRATGAAYRSEVVTLDASRVLSTQPIASIADIALEQNFPNPVRSSEVTAIRFRIPTSMIATLSLYDVFGREIKTVLHENLPYGEHLVSFSTTGLERGTYFYRLTTARGALTKKLVIR